MGSDQLPPFSWTEAASNWQFAPVVTVVTAVVAALYLWGVVRVRPPASRPALAGAGAPPRSSAAC